MTYPLAFIAIEALSFIDMALHIEVFIIASPKMEARVQPRPRPWLTVLALFSHWQMFYVFKQSCLFVCGNAELNIRPDSRPAYQASNSVQLSRAKRERLRSGRSIGAGFEKRTICVCKELSRGDVYSRSSTSFVVR